MPRQLEIDTNLGNTLTWTSTITGSGSGKVDITGRATGDDAILALALSMARLNDSVGNAADLVGTWTVSTDLEATGETPQLESAGTLMIESTGTLWINTTGGLLIDNDSTLINNGLIDLLIDGVVIDNAAGFGTLINNTIRKSAGSGASSILNVTCSPQGLLDALAGSIDGVCGNAP